MLGTSSFSRAQCGVSVGRVQQQQKSGRSVLSGLGPVAASLFDFLNSYLRIPLFPTPTMDPPVLGSETTASPSPLATPTLTASPHMVKRTSTSSVPTLSLNGSRDYLSYKPTRRSSSIASTNSIQFGEGEVEVVTEEGLKHAEVKLVAKRYKTGAFAQSLLDVILDLRVPSWYSASLGPLSSEKLKIQKVAGSLTNAVFFVSYPSVPSIRTLLLRIYGPSSSMLISRPRELHTLHILSSEFHIGPHVYGTFENGRVEEYFDSMALTAAELRDPQVSRWIGARMAELHAVDVDAVDATADTGPGDMTWGVNARKNVISWLEPAREVLALRSFKVEIKESLAFDGFEEEWNHYMTWLAHWEKLHGASKRVFAHNDAQYGNLLRLKNIKEGTPEHRQIIVVDFEYAGPNPAAFDIANHFHEWTADYHSRTPYLLDPARYPTEPERQNFYRAYLAHACPPYTTVHVPDGAGSTPGFFGPLTAVRPGSPEPQYDAEFLDVDKEAARLEAQVRAWSPASHAMWAVWGIVQAREDLELELAAKANGTVADAPEFDYLRYAMCRMESFRREMRALGL